MFRLSRRFYYSHSCAYSKEKPLVTPFWASLLAGSMVTTTVIAEGARVRLQLDRMELEIRGLKEAQGSPRK